MKKILFTLLIVLSILGIFTTAGQAILVPSLSFLELNRVDHNLDPTRDLIIGYEFRTNQPIIVAQLGVYDHFLNGLAENHLVGIFDSTSHNLLASTNVATSNPLLNRFRYNSLNTPLFLPANHTYRIAALAGHVDEFGADPRNLFINPAITYIDGSVDFISPAAGQLDFPNFSLTDLGLSYVGVFGPNFRFEALPNSPSAPVVPEPVTLTLLGSGLAGFWVRRKKS